MSNHFGLLANLVDLLFIILGKTGKFLNARGNRLCFLIELFVLTYWCYIDVQRGLFSQAGGCFVSMLIACYGYRRWGRLNREAT